MPLRFTSLLLRPAFTHETSKVQALWRGAKVFYSVCFVWALAAPFARSADGPDLTSPASSEDLRRQQQRARLQTREQHLQEGENPCHERCPLQQLPGADVRIFAMQPTSLRSLRRSKASNGAPMQPSSPFMQRTGASRRQRRPSSWQAVSKGLFNSKHSSCTPSFKAGSQRWTLQ